MGVKRIHYIPTLIILFTTLENFPLEIIASEINRVVFQSFFLEDDDVVRCYGRCDKALEDVGRITQTFNVTRCEGRRLRFTCSRGNRIKVQKAAFGKLNPDFDICSYGKPLYCVQDISIKVQTTCNGLSQCLVDVTNYQLGSNCGKIEHLALDIQYLCVKTRTEDTTKNRINKILTKATAKRTSRMTSDKKRVNRMKSHKKIGNSISNIIQGGMEKKPILPRLTKKGIDTKVVAKNGKETTVFFLYIIHTLISDSDLIKLNISRVAFVLFLSMFIGIIVCMICCIVYCKREQVKKYKYQNTSLAVESNDRMELIKPNMVKITTLRETLEKHKIVLPRRVGKNINASRSVSVALKKSNTRQNLLIRKHLDRKQRRPFVPSTLQSSQQHDVTVDSEGDRNDIPCPKPSSANPTTTKSLMLSRKSVCDKDNSGKVQVKEVDLEKNVFDDNIEGLQHEYVQIEQYNASEEYFVSPSQVPCTMEYHTTDNYVVIPPRVQISPMNRRSTSNDETSEEDTFIRKMDSKRIRKCNTKDKPGLQKSERLNEPKKRIFVINNGRNSKRGGIHVMQSCNEPAHRRSCDLKVICSDDEASSITRRREIEKKRRTSLPASQRQISNCCLSSTSADYKFPLLSFSNEYIKNKKLRIEGSGYHSHGTGTDSLYNSTSDQDGSYMFLPSSVNNPIHNTCRSKPCQSRRQTSKVVYRAQLK